MNNNIRAANIKYNENVLNNNQLKINVESDNHYRELTKLLNTKKVEWHSYENKQTRPIRVMVRNLHPFYDVSEIKRDLEKKGLKILEVNNKIRITRLPNGENKVVPLPLFMLTYDQVKSS